MGLFFFFFVLSMKNAWDIFNGIYAFIWGLSTISTLRPQVLPSECILYYLWKWLIQFGEMSENQKKNSEMWLKLVRAHKKSWWNMNVAICDTTKVN